jgi:hypothetical protein
MYTKGVTASRVVVRVNHHWSKSDKSRCIQGADVSSILDGQPWSLVLLSRARGQARVRLCHIGASRYTHKLLDKATMGTCNPCHMPMEVRLDLSTKSLTPEVDVTMYKSLVGNLAYMFHTKSVCGGFCESLHGETATRESSLHHTHHALHHRHSRLGPCLP